MEQSITLASNNFLSIFVHLILIMERGWNSSLYSLFFHALVRVQEALARQMNDLQTALPNYRYYGVGRNDGKTKGEYSAIFYRSDLLKTVHFDYRKHRLKLEVKAEIRICGWVQLRDKQTFYHFNTHFDHISARLQSSDLSKMLKVSPYCWILILLTNDFFSFLLSML
jgi:hypothetical protein